MESLSQADRNKRDYFSEPMSQFGDDIKAASSFLDKYKVLMGGPLALNEIGFAVFFRNLENLPFLKKVKIS